MIVYAITSHGYGHLVRAATVIAALDPVIPLTLLTQCPEPLVRRLLAGRPFELAPVAFDCGTLGPDSSSVDPAQTLDALEGVLARRPRQIEEETARLASIAARVVVCDAPALPLAAARRAGVSSILATNFTWTAIYAGLVEQLAAADPLRPRFDRAIATLQADYDAGDLLLEPGLAIPQRACRARRPVPLIARRGRPRRAELAAGMGLDPARPIYLVYLGAEGRAGMDYDRLAALRDPQAPGHPPQLVAYAVPPGAAPAIRPIPDGLVSDADLIATVDAVIAKPGYATTAECMAHGTPLLTTHRPHFVESAGIERAIAEWGGGAFIPADEFTALDWEPWLARVPALRAAARPLAADGAEQIAAEIHRLWRAAAPPRA
jgi:hypothetical protein